LKKLRGGASKVIITSRSQENWLKSEYRKIPISGLDGEERWLYFDEIVSNIGVRIKRDEPELVELMDMLGGHPLSMQVIIPLLERQSAATLKSSLQNGLTNYELQIRNYDSESEGDEAIGKFYATLELAVKALPDELQALWILLGLHERFVHFGLFEDMAKQVKVDQVDEKKWTSAKIRTFAENLCHIGVLTDKGDGICELHPALTGFLRSRLRSDIGLDFTKKKQERLWIKAFVDVMGRLADDLAPKQLHEQRTPFFLFGASFYFAMNQAHKIGMDAHFKAILQSLAAYALNMHNYKEAEDLYLRFVEANKVSGNAELEAAAYHQIGRIAEGKRDFDLAEVWYRKSLKIKEKQGNEHGAANTYGQLGNMAQEKRDFDSAEIWYKKALEIFEKQGNEHGTASSYHQLGIIAEEKRDFDSAESWYRKSLEIKEKQGNEHGAAISYHQLGRIAQEKRDFDSAESWYKKSLEIDEKQGNEHGAAATYHQLGNVAYEKSDFDSAESWYKKSLEIFEKQGNEHGSASTYGQLGNLADLQGHFEESGKWLIKAILLFSKCNAPAEVEQAASIFQNVHKQAEPETQTKLKALWEEVGLPTVPWMTDDGD
jgi:tetratricopeptide (TPR) repeat protein